MSNIIKLKKGLNIKLLGEAEKTVVDINSDFFALKPTDFIGVFPKLMVKEGDEVKAGTVVFYDKYRQDILFSSPVSGTITEIKRGPKRLLEEIRIKANGKSEYESFQVSDPKNLSKEEITELLRKSGIWPCLRQRPYSVIANPGDDPKAIFISAFDTSPHGLDYDFIVHGKGELFQKGLDALKKLTSGKVHLNVNPQETTSRVFHKSKDVQINQFTGPHPSGNVGIQIHHVDPINKGDIVWYLNPQDVLIIGKFFTEGKYDASCMISMSGSEVLKPRYYKTIKGTSVKPILDKNVKDGEHRYISGNVLTGKKIQQEGYLGYYDYQLSVIPEGNYFEFLGWALPGLGKFSVSRSFTSWMCTSKKYSIDTNLHGGERAFVLSGEYEKVLPMDIFPVHLLKAILAEDIDLMENLGIYEVDEEDFALCEFVCTSKVNSQDIIRKGLDLMRKEMS
ncbi:MAG: Na(+)-translocating NADH-quinone reductase subunit A [Bacteroidales bacterium]|nr:Na(+)-translocating NADH-quinone reductase subunit A [Bacteroidales bacterium]